MIDLRSGLGAPPIVFPGVRMAHPEAPPAPPGGALIMPKNQMAQTALGCGAGSTVPGSTMPGSRGVGDLLPWYQKLAAWQKISLAVGGSAILFGIGYGVYRLAR